MFQKVSKQRVEVLSSTFAFADAVATIRVGHKLKLSIMFDKFIDQHFGILIMYVIIACAVDIK